jgi:GNAT superfamily N-acetyltransferase
MNDPRLLNLVATAIANARGGRRGAPPVSNILDLLPSGLREEVCQDAEAVLSALAHDPERPTLKWPPFVTTSLLSDVGANYLELTLGRCQPDAYTDEPRCHIRVEREWIQLCGLYVPHFVRGQGLTTILVDAAKEYCLPQKLPLYIEVNPFGVLPMSREDLMQWYARGHGFKPVAGHPYAMVWTPS